MDPVTGFLYFAGLYLGVKIVAYVLDDVHDYIKRIYGNGGQ